MEGDFCEKLECNANCIIFFCLQTKVRSCGGENPEPIDEGDTCGEAGGLGCYRARPRVPSWAALAHQDLTLRSFCGQALRFRVSRPVSMQISWSLFGSGIASLNILSDSVSDLF